MVKLENVEFQFVDSPLLLLKYCNETGECQVQGQDAGPGGWVDETKLYVWEADQVQNVQLSG